MRIGQRLQQNSVYNTEYRRVRPNPKRQRHGRDDREAGFLHSIRTPYRKSRQHVSTKNSQPPERTISLVTSRLPRSSRTSRSASLRLTPCLIFSAASISK